MIDKINLSNKEELIDRDKCFRLVINNKKYDTSHEDDVARYVINNTRFKDMLLIRYEYYISKVYHGLGKGDLAFLDKDNIIYTVETKSLKDRYANITDSAKIEKCKTQAFTYANYASKWTGTGKKGIAVTAIETDKGIIITELKSPINSENSDDSNNSEDSNNSVSDVEEINECVEVAQGVWHKDIGDSQTNTQYKINGDMLIVQRIIDYEPSKGARKHFRKRAERMARNMKCTKYYVVMKNVKDEVILREYHTLEKNDERLMKSEATETEKFVNNLISIKNAAELRDYSLDDCEV